MLNLAGLVIDSIVDGPGIRVTVFMQGCSHHCKGCQNAETWSYEGGTKLSVLDVFELIKKNPLASGVTFSGGEPFDQASELKLLSEKIKNLGYEVASYSGYTFEELLNGTKEQKELLETIDILVDGKFVLEEKSLEVPFRGSKNQRIINVNKSLKAGKVVLETSTRWNGEY
jgi:anaerobic ribonucleoside-triphosphate reductase activating protein